MALEPWTDAIMVARWTCCASRSLVEPHGDHVSLLCDVSLAQDRCRRSDAWAAIEPTTPVAMTATMGIAPDPVSTSFGQAQATDYFTVRRAMAHERRLDLWIDQQLAAGKWTAAQAVLMGDVLLTCETVLFRPASVKFFRAQTTLVELRQRCGMRDWSRAKWATTAHRVMGMRNQVIEQFNALPSDAPWSKRWALQSLFEPNPAAEGRNASKDQQAHFFGVPHRSAAAWALVAAAAAAASSAFAPSSSAADSRSMAMS